MAAYLEKVLCSVQDCKQPARKNKLCSLHYLKNNPSTMSYDEYKKHLGKAFLREDFDSVDFLLLRFHVDPLGVYYIDQPYFFNQMAMGQK